MKDESEIAEDSDFKNLKASLKEVENQKTELSEEKKNLTKYNLALESKVSKYALLLSEEKEEKKQFISKNEDLQKELRDKIELFGNEKIKRAKRYYIVIGVSIMLMIGLIIVLLPYLKTLIN